MKSALISLLTFLALGTNSLLAQTQAGSIHGRVVRNGTGENIVGAKLSVNTLETFQALPAVAKASTSLILRREASEAAVQYLTAPRSDIDATMQNYRETNVSPDLVAAFAQLQAARAKAPGFPQIAISDANGQFSFENLPAGRYMVVAERDGFYGVPTTSANVLKYAAAPADIANSQSTPEITVIMTSGALISGKVSDSNGKPQVSINVQAFTTTYKAGLPVLEAVTEKQTDDRGEFRLFWLPAGDYLVAATPKAAPIGGPSTSGGMVIKTFYPNVPQPTQSTPISVRVGDEVSRIDIELQTVRTVKISGQVVDTLGPRTDLPAGVPIPVPVATLMLMQRDPSVPDDNRNSILGMIEVSNGSAKFEVTNIPPGRYDMYTRIPDPRGSSGQGGQYQAWGRKPIDVLDQDITNVTLTVHPSVPVKGVLTIDSTVPGASGNLIRVGLSPDGSSSKMANYNGVLGRQQAPAADGTFTIPGVAEANYRFVVNGLPIGAYIDDIQSGGGSVFDSGLYVADGSPGTVQVHVKSSGGTVEGVVTTGDRRTAPNTTVVLVPEVSRRQNAMLYKTSTTNAQGEFSIRGVRPGSYKVFAWESVAEGAYLNAVFMSKFESRGMAVSVSASSTSNTTVTVIPKN